MCKIVLNLWHLLVNSDRCFSFLLLIYLTVLSLLLSLTHRESQPIQGSKLQWIIGRPLQPFQEDKSVLERDNSIQKQRQAGVRDVCKYLQSEHQSNASHWATIQPDALSQLYVDDKHGFIYCEVPKVACTNFKAIMEILTGHLNATDPDELPRYSVHHEYQINYLRKLSNYTPNEISYRLDSYYKFMFVREPFERIVSAYRDKFTRDNDYFQIRFGRYIVKKYRENPSNESLAKGNDVTFNEFVRYLIDPYTIGELELNAHWQHYHKLCLPCQIKYNFIGKFEHLKDDADRAFYDIGIRHIVKFPGETPQNLTSAGVVKHFFGNITSEDIHQLWRLYSVDYRMFGYEYPSFYSQGTAH